MLLNNKGISVYWILSAILFVGLIFILALPHFFNLDTEKNIDDCTNNMKVIWVATSDYVADTRADFGGDLNLLTRTKKKQDPKNVYLPEKLFCPEQDKNKQDYIVYGKFVEDFLETGESRVHTGVIVLCPELIRHNKHFLDKAFYENMSPSLLQNYMVDDLDYIDQQTKSDGERKYQCVMDYINMWKSDKDAFAKRKADTNHFRRQLFPDAFQNLSTGDDFNF